MTDLFTNNDDQSQIAAYLPGETNRYKTIEDLAKGKYHADMHAKTLEQENADLRASNLKLREDNVAKAKLEEYVDQLTRGPAARTEPAFVGTNPQPENVKPPFDPNQIESLVQSKIKEHEVTKTREQNAKSVVDTLKERYGHNYLDVLTKQSEELGMTKDVVNFLAETSPKAFLKTLGLDEAPKTDPFAAPPRNSALFSPKPEPKRTWAYYEQMRKDQPNLYKNPKTQEQMMKDYQVLGKSFEDGNFLAYGQESAY